MTTIQAAINTETQERLARKKQHIQDNSLWEQVVNVEMPAQSYLGIEQLSEQLVDVDEAELVKVLIYRRKVVESSSKGA